MGSEEMKHKTNAEYVTLLSFFDSTPSDLKKILLEQPIQHTDDNESRSLIFPTTYFEEKTMNPILTMSNLHGNHQYHDQ